MCGSLCVCEGAVCVKRPANCRVVGGWVECVCMCGVSHHLMMRWSGKRLLVVGGGGEGSSCANDVNINILCVCVKRVCVCVWV